MCEILSFILRTTIFEVIANKRQRWGVFFLYWPLDVAAKSLITPSVENFSWLFFFLLKFLSSLFIEQFNKNTFCFILKDISVILNCLHLTLLVTLKDTIKLFNFKIFQFLPPALRGDRATAKPIHLSFSWFHLIDQIWSYSLPI